MSKKEELYKSIDEQIDAIFTEPAEEVVEKAKSQMDELIGKEPKKSSSGGKLPLSGESQQLADSGEKPKKPKNAEDGDGGRPKDPSKMSSRDQYGDAKVSYDKDISAPAKVPANETTVAKSEESPKEDTITLSKEEFETLTKAKAILDAQKEEEKLQKAENEQKDLIKSIVSEATKGIQEELKKSQDTNTELTQLVKSMGKRPRQQKSISSVGSLEKSFGANTPGAQPESFSKSEMLDAGEELVKANKLPVEAVIELEESGNIVNPEYRKLIERQLQKQG